MTRIEMLNPKWSRSNWIINFSTCQKMFYNWSLQIRRIPMYVGSHTSSSVTKDTGRILVKDLEIVKQNVTLSTLRVCFTSSQMLRRRKT